jgi:8-amino-7-oxononanoate synthase
MACRFPGSARTPAEFWRVLENGADEVTTIPPDRWGLENFLHPNRSAPGKSYTFSAGVLGDVKGFDAEFFGVSPREAAQLDPQQRLLLELAWEAMEDGGQIPDRLAGTDCGVYVGISGTDYANRRVDDPASGDAYVMSGGTLSIAANRISFFLDLHGPSLAIDTACSSSLVALHYACRDLRSGDTSMALVGGVNMLLAPFPFLGFAKASMLSVDGRCRAFAYDGQGYVRSEGGALVILKPLLQAEADGDSIHAVITASGVNCDGRGKSLSVPRAEVQEALLRSVYAQTELGPAGVSYVEAHGTGTPAGDPAEVEALGRALGLARAAGDPLPIGSAKTNVGHLESAAGMVGLLKVVLSLQHRQIPASLHFDRPNSRIPFADLNVKVVTELTSLPANGRPAVMGVNSFGFGGANAHVVVEEYRQEVHTGERKLPRFVPLFLSAKSEPALRETAGRYRELLLSPKAPLAYDIAHGAATRRPRHQYRLAVVGRDNSELCEALGRFVSGEMGQAIVSGTATSAATRLALLFSGNGSQWQGMGRRLLGTDRVFSQHVQKVDDLLRPRAGFSVIEELNRGMADSRLNRTEVAQPLLFALQVGLFETLVAHGVVVSAVLGHSVGEVAAAYAAGALDLHQAVHVIHERSRAQEMTYGLGRMAAVGLGPNDVLADIAGFDGEIELAAVNSPTSVTVSGPGPAIEKLGTRLASRGVFFRILDLEYPFHSRLMDITREHLLGALAGLEPGPPSRLFASTVTGQLIEAPMLDADYWWRNVRSPVRLDQAVTRLLEQGIGVFLEVGPHPVLQTYLRENLGATRESAHSLATLRRNDDDEVQLWRAICGVHVLGCPLDLEKLYPARGERVALPLYPWQREPHWHATTNEALGALGRPYEHPLLGYRVRQTEGCWESEIDVDRFRYLADHRVGDTVLFPAAGFTEIAIAAAELRSPGTSHELEALEFRAPLVFEGSAIKNIRCQLQDDGAFTIKSRPRLSDEPWTLNVVGRLTSPSLRKRPPGVDIGRAMSALSQHIAGATHYAQAKAVGLSYGPAFQGVQELWTNGDEALARLTLPAVLGDEAAGYLLHPSLLDSCLQVMVEICATRMDPGRPFCFLPFQLGRMVYYRSAGRTAFCRATVKRRSARSVVARLQLLDDSGETLAELEDFRFRQARWVRGGTGAPAYYSYRPFLRSRPGTDNGHSLPRPPAIAERIVGPMVSHSHRYGRAGFYERVLPLMDELVAAFAFRAVDELTGGRRNFSFDSMVSTGNVDPQHHFLLRRLLEILREDGFLGCEGGECTLATDPGLRSPEKIWRQLVGDFPAYLTEAAAVGRCGIHLPQLLRGEMSEDLLEANGAWSVAAQLCDASPSWHLANQALKDALGEIVRGWPAGQSLRILELSCGALGLTADLLAALPIEHCRYVFTHAHESIRAHAKAQLVDFAGYSVLELDIDADPATGPLAPNSFDVVIASHVLHDARTPEIALKNIGRLLSANGLLLVLERSPDRMSDLVYGTNPTWWKRSVDAGRPVSRLRSINEWTALIESRGFAELATVAEPAQGFAPGTYLLLARNQNQSLDDFSTAPRPSRSCLVLADEEGDSRVLAEQLAAALRAEGDRPILVVAGDRFSRRGVDEFAVAPDARADFARLMDILHAENRRVDEIVHLMGLAFRPDADGLDLLEIQDRRCVSTVHLVQAIGGLEGVSPPRLWLVTAGGAAIESDSSRPGLSGAIPSQAPLWGLRRVLANEHPELRCRLVDLSPSLPPETVASLLMAELLDPDDEDEVLLAAGTRYGMRLEKVGLAAPKPVAWPDSGSGVRLDFSSPGQLTNLGWYADPYRPPKNGEIAVRVRATGLNFRDVMYTMGMLSDEAVEDGFAGATLGMECAGDVIEAGPDVTGFEVGDRVVCFARQCFASHLTTGTTAVARMPRGWTYEEAATVPSAFFTAYYSLCHLAGLEAGEKVLIHGGAGGVGLAAIQLAHHRGAEVFASAGSPRKRDFLRLIGVEHVLDSRSLAFADDVRKLTDGAGVDVVLNSISGEAVRKSLGALRPFGRFIELGKRDYYENAKLGLRPFRNNITYFGVDADQLMVQRGDLAGRLFREMMALFDRGALRPLVHRVFPSNRVADAFRHMLESLQIGKIVVVNEQSITAVRETAPATEPLALRADASYLITGGLGGFGLATARWMVEKGARSLVLVGRSGAATSNVKAAVGELEAMGARVEVCQADVTRLDDLRPLFQRFGQDLPALGGIVHAAMVLEDRLVRNLDRDAVRRVLAPKIQGAWNLHELTRDLLLDFFVLYSSATTSFGNPGQASYVAANLYLESLAHYRRELRLPALAVGWGPLSDVGVLAGNEAVRAGLVMRTGARELTSTQALQQLERLLEADRSGVAVVDLDWQTLRRSMPAARSIRFEGLGGRGSDHGDERPMQQDVRALLVDLPEVEALAAITDLLREQIGAVLRMPAARIGPDAFIHGLGMDSLMAVELQLRIEDRFGVSLPVTAVSANATAAQLARRIKAQLLDPGERGDVSPADERRETADALIARHGSSMNVSDIGQLVDSIPVSDRGTPPVVPSSATGQGRSAQSRMRFADLPGYREFDLQRAAIRHLGIENPFFRVHQRVAGATARIDGREYINFASFNYLGLCGHPAVAAAAKDAIDQYGTSASASRPVSGERPPYRQLEQALAKIHGTDDCAINVGGWATNVTTIGHLFGARDLILHDALIHNSLLQGAILSGARRRPFPHSDWQALDEILTNERGNHERVVIVVEGIYSMDGDFPDLRRVIELKERHAAFLMVDEAHSVGVLGQRGFGIGEHFGIKGRDVDIWMGTLSKALASTGGYIAGEQALVDYLKASAPGFLYATAIAPSAAASALAALELMQAEPERITRLRERSRLFFDLATRAGLDTGYSAGYAVIPVIVGNSLRSVRLANALFARGINVQPIVHPAVEERSARLRFFISCDHTEEQVRETVQSVVDEMHKLN